MNSSSKQSTFLKALKLKGFKSFARPTTILFSPGISAIVGPNGCGKSNVVDAIKWVLGEQGFKPLRSKTAEDLIFSGTDKRPPLGMAEVSLILEQTTNPALSEVMITRRVFRSGENNYLLNKHQCRLKDIKEVLLNAGFGLKNYAIIDQGQIAHLLELSPLEKRHLLEEAAGVTKYRGKKEETLRKIEDTKQNLLRLEDIIGEVEVQVRKLSLQAKRAKEYLNLKETLNQVRLSLLLKVYHTKEVMLKTKISQAKALKQEQTQLEDQYRILHQDLERLKKVITTTQQRLKEQEQTLWELEINKKQMTFMLDKFDEQKKEYEKREETLKRRREKCIVETEELVKQKQSITKEITSLTKQIVSAQKNIQSLHSEITLIEEKLKENKPILKQKTKTLEEIKQRLIKIDADLEHLSYQEKRIHQQKEKEEKKKEELENKSKESIKEIKDIQKRLENIKEKIETLRIRQKIAQQDYEVLSLKSRCLQKALLKLEETFIRFKSQLKTVRLWLERHQPKQNISIDETIGQIMDIITDAQGLEDAVEAIIRLKAGPGWLVKNMTSALDILNSQSAQELISLVLLDADVSLSLSVGKTIGTPLIDLIQVKEEYKSLAIRFFSNVYIIDSLPSDLSPLSSNIIFVTPQGDILTGEGVIHRGHSQGILKEYLKQKKLFVRLKKEVKALENKLPSVKKRFAEIKVKLRQEEAFLKEVEKKIASYEEEKSKLKELEIQQTEFLKYASLQKGEVEKKLLEISNEWKYIEKEKQYKIEQRAKIKGESQMLEKELQLLSQRIKEAKTLKEEKNRLLHQYTWQNQELIKKKDYLEKEKKRLEKRSQEIALQNQEVLAELEDIANRKVAMERQKEEAKHNIDKYEIEEIKLKQTINDLKKNLNQLLGQKREIVNKIENIEYKNRNLTESLRTLDIEISRLTGESNVLKERLQKEYNICEITSLLPPLDLAVAELEQKKTELENKLEKMQAVNLGAIEEYEQISERYNFLKSQRKDLKNSSYKKHPLH